MLRRFLPGLLAAATLIAAASSCLAQTIVDAATTNASISITTGNTFQQALAALGAPPAQRRSLTIANNNTNSDSCWIYIGATASATKALSILLLPGGSYTRYYPYVPSDNIAATCTTTADTLYLDTQ
jgi:hypothetical protein